MRESKMENSLPLHLCKIPKSSIIFNRSHAFFHFIALVTLILYRLSFFFQTSNTKNTPLFPWLLVFASEVLLSFIWILNVGYRWRPVYRTALPERLPDDKELPSIDVFVCTADPDKEPTLGVMNTVVSAMALDYPPEKLNVYVSDDGGSPVTLGGMRAARRFAKGWLPFCRRYGIKTRCPGAYFSAAKDEDGEFYKTEEFVVEESKVKKLYEEFKGSIEKLRENASTITNSRDHPPVVEVINDDCSSNEIEIDEEKHIPQLVYVSREKRPSHPHHFKAGALNVLQRVSGLISNSTYILALDCDMYCNDPSSARQAMCFHFDPKISPSLAFVQFPQRFHNISPSDIYGSQLRSAFKVLWQGMDGVGGPVLSGTGFYLKREALYATSHGVEIKELKQTFGASNEFLKSLRGGYDPKITSGDGFSRALRQETLRLASCDYENDTKWGLEVGFRYFSVAEDLFSGFLMQCKGWTSVYLDPQRPSFLGTATTNLNDVLVQGTRWGAGLVGVGLSRFCPLIYGTSPSSKMSILGSMCYGELTLFPLCYFFPVWCLATTPQLCLLNGISLYPEVSSSYFMVFSFIFVSYNLKQIEEILSTGGTIQTWMNEQRIWMIKSITCHFYGSINVILEKFGLREASFSPTNKAVDDEQETRYQNGTFDFQTSTMFLGPLCALVILNVVSSIGGVARTVFEGTYNEMFIQIFLSFYAAIMNYPIIDGMIFRMDKGKISRSVALLSFVSSMVFLALGSFILQFC